MLSGPLQAIQDINELMALRRSANMEAKPLIVWEPRPSSCVPEYLPLFEEAARLVDVFSPNHVELAAIFSVESGQAYPHTIMRYADKLLQSGIGIEGQGYIVVRSGEQGSFITSKQVSFWCPAYYEDEGGSGDPHVVDPTGAGNAFLGAFAIGFLQGNLVYQAACYGAVGASFALEQIGLPEKSLDKDGAELWNGDSPFDRLKRYQQRVKNTLEDQT